MRIEGRDYRDGRAIEAEIVDGRIAALRPLNGVDPGRLPWLAPAFLDIQSNGYGGREFSSLELTGLDVQKISRQQAAFGVARYLPTVTTGDRATLLHALRVLAQACQNWPEVDEVVAGIHLEGPYISAQEGPRGAHPAPHCRPPDWREFEELQAAAGGRIRLVTLSPEYPQAAAFIRRATDAGICVAIGHTAATRDQILAAVDAGARLSTHLGNGCHGMLRRHPNYLWDQLAEDRLAASLIVDGFHLPPEVVKTMVRAKGPQRCILISDLSGLAGLPPGRYESNLSATEILADGRLVVAGQEQFLAGASRPIGTGVANVIRFAGVDLAAAIAMASRNPAARLGLDFHDLEPGSRADLVLFRLAEDETAPSASIEIVALFRAGNRVFAGE